MKRGRRRLRSFEISGFKSIPYNNPIRIELGDVNLLIGANGSEKSNILSFFELLHVMMKGSLQRYIAVNGTSQRLLHYGPEHTSSLKATLKFTNGRSSEEYKFCLSADGPSRLMVSSEELEIKRIKRYSGKDCGYRTVKRELGENLPESSLENTQDPTELMIRKLLLSCKRYSFDDTTLSAALRQPSAIESGHYLHSDASNLASFLYFLQNNYFESYSRIIDIVHLILPQFRDFCFEPGNGYVSLGWTDKTTKDYVFGADQLSDGSLSYIALATLLLQPTQTMPFVILLDCPELGLHPDALHNVIHMIRDASLHAQIIIATQSTEILDAFKADDVTVVDWDKTKQGTVIHQLSVKEYEICLEDYTLSELWKKNVFDGLPS